MVARNPHGNTRTFGKGSTQKTLEPKWLCVFVLSFVRLLAGWLAGKLGSELVCVCACRAVSPKFPIRTAFAFRSSLSPRLEPRFGHRANNLWSTFVRSTQLAQPNLSQSQLSFNGCQGRRKNVDDGFSTRCLLRVGSVGERAFKTLASFCCLRKSKGQVLYDQAQGQEIDITTECLCCPLFFFVLFDITMNLRGWK